MESCCTSGHRVPLHDHHRPQARSPSGRRLTTGQRGTIRIAPSPHQPRHDEVRTRRSAAERGGHCGRHRSGGWACGDSTGQVVRRLARNGQAEPLLPIRTQQNVARELARTPQRSRLACAMRCHCPPLGSGSRWTMARPGSSDSSPSARTSRRRSRAFRRTRELPRRDSRDGGTPALRGPGGRRSRPSRIERIAPLRVPGVVRCARLRRQHLPPALQARPYRHPGQ